MSAPEFSCRPRAGRRLISRFVVSLDSHHLLSMAGDADGQISFPREFCALHSERKGSLTRMTVFKYVHDSRSTYGLRHQDFARYQ